MTLIPIDWYYPTGAGGAVPCKWACRWADGTWSTIVLVGV